MELSALTELFSSVGLPVAIVVVLIFVIYLMGKRMTEQSDKNMERIQEQSKEREDRLYSQLDETRRVNEKAIDTIGRYAEKLDNIQSDVKEIKQDLSMMMMNGGHHE